MKNIISLTFTASVRLFILGALIPVSFDAFGQEVKNENGTSELNSNSFDINTTAVDKAGLMFKNGFWIKNSNHYAPQQNSLSAPTNDNCASATPVTVGGPVVAGSTIGATVQAGELKSCAPSADQTVWFSFVPPGPGTSYAVTVSWVASSGCYFSSAIWGPGGPCPATSGCSTDRCQSAAWGPFVHTYRLTALTIGATYYIQVMYQTGGVCGAGPAAGADFTVQVVAGAVANPTNPPPWSTWQAPLGTACDFGYPPTALDVTTSCPSYLVPVNLQNVNQVNHFCVNIFTLQNPNFNFQVIVQSNCGAGNVSWLIWQLYTPAGVLIDCGTLPDLGAIGQCNTNYVACFSWEVPNCTHSIIWPYFYTTNVTCSPLPVKLLSFDANYVEEGVELKWVTASESNNDYFIIERKNNDGSFHEVSPHMPAEGNSTNGAMYQTIDMNPQDGINYYRLKQVDFNGTTTYSATRSVRVNRPIKFELFPSPAHIGMQVVSNQSGKLMLTSSSGFRSFTQTIEKGEQTVDVSKFSSGLYFSTFTPDDGSEILRSKIIIK